MKHAGADALDRLSPLLSQIRNLPALKERSRGVFYLRAKAFLHFHEDPKGLFADIRAPNGEFERIKVDGPSPMVDFVVLVEGRIGALTAAIPRRPAN